MNHNLHRLKAGYAVGSTGKAYGPSDMTTEGWQENPAGKEYLEIELDAPEGIRNTDYAANFDAFLNDNKDGILVWCFRTSSKV